ncbi:MAG: SBBP repeat-containing protein [Nitrospinaceae bacterium]
MESPPPIPLSAWQPAPASDRRTSTPAPGPPQALFRRLPLHFEPNAGQADAKVRFLTRGHGFGLYLTPEAMLLVLNGPQPEAEDAATASPEPTGIRISWPGAQPGRPEPLAPLPGKINYLLGNRPDRWRTGLPTYSRIRYPDLYPGVDLLVYGDRGKPKYDFIVHPGAHPSIIRLAYAEVEGLSLDPAGNLHLKTTAGEVTQPAPVIYQEIGGVRVLRSGRYVLHGNRGVGFEMDAYDAAHPLVIDPIIVERTYATFFGGMNTEIGASLTLDSGGNIYLAGQTQSTDLPTQNPLQGGFGGGASDAFVAKLNAQGDTLVYATYLGGSRLDEALAIGLDASGQAYVTGRTDSTDFPTRNPVQGSLKSKDDAFVAKLSADGSGLVFSTYLGGAGNDKANGLAVDAAGNVYVTGETDSSNFPTQNPFQGNLGNGQGAKIDAFLTKLTPTGNALVYSTYLGGQDREQGFGVAVDSGGNAYVTGVTQSTDFPTQNPLQAVIGDTIGATTDAFVTKVDAAGNSLLWSTYLGGAGDDAGNGITVDGSGNVYLTGSTDSTNFPTLNPAQANRGGLLDAFASKILSTGAGLAFSTYLGGAGTDTGFGVAVDLAGNLHVAGFTDSANFPVLNPLQSSNAGGEDGFVTRLNSFGNALTWSTFLGGVDDDRVTGLVLNATGQPHLTGFTKSADFPTLKPLQASLGGGNGLDAFVVKLVSTVINRLSVYSPFFQADSGIYTFIAVTHPSLSGMNSLIGVQARAFTDTGNQFGATAEFTIEAGHTHRIFLTRPNHPLLNPVNFPQAVFILGTQGLGRLRIDPVSTNPGKALPGGGFTDVTMMSYWGAVVMEDTMSGFAINFIGDLTDSSAHPGMAPGLFPSGVN